MSKLKFEPSDFDSTTGIRYVQLAPSTAASIANARLAEMLKDCPVVYGYKEEGVWLVSTARAISKCKNQDSHQAILVNVEELPRPECKHELDTFIRSGDFCRHCKQELEPTGWRIKA